MGKNRLEAFSDGMIAIIITIMVLEMKVPHRADLGALRPMIPVFLSYVLSFVYLGIYWNNHHHMIHTCHRVTAPILWANLHLLFWLSLIPFATGWMGENRFQSVPATLYGMILLMAAISYFLLQQAIIASQGEDSLLKRAIGSDWKGKVSPILYAIAIPLALWRPWTAMSIYTLVALLWLIPDRRIERVLTCAVLCFWLIPMKAAAGPETASNSPGMPGGWERVATKGETCCALGTPYSFFHRNGADSSRLLIYFEGGGACWDWVSCSGLFDSTVQDDELSEYRGIFDATNPENPFRDFEIVFVPYCTGDVFVGDAKQHYGDDPSSHPIAHRGFANVEAILAWMARQDPHPGEVVVAGTSAGSYGALFYAPVIERQFPKARIVMLGDSGVPLLKDTPAVLHTWGADRVLQKIWQEEAGKSARQHPLREAYRQVAAAGDRVRLAEIFSDQDAVQGAFYLVSGSPGWRDSTNTILADVQKNIPAFRSFIIEGTNHGLLPTDAFYRYQVDGVYLKDWVEELIDGKPVEDVRCTKCALD